ncbi:MAG: NADH-quinone oxidoreductase subunit N [Candidatus Aminicenantales bacterium]
MTGTAVLAPLLFLIAGAITVLLLTTFRKGKSASLQAAVSLAALAAAGGFAARLWNRGARAFGGQLRWDEAALFLTFLILLAAAATVLLGLRFVVRHEMPRGEYFGLLLLASSGLVIMAATINLLVVFLGLEVFSVSAYALSGLMRRDDRSTEAAVKYFLIGSFASAFVVFGLALAFGATRTLDAYQLVAGLSGTDGAPALAMIGLALIICGMAFKIALVPFHMYQPDVYEGAPTPVSAFFAAAPKAAGFLVLLRLTLPWVRAGVRQETLFGFLGAVAIATMLVGNFGALRQRNIKRILAYSSIAHAGYMLIAVVSRDPAGLFFYLANYLFLGLGSFAAVMALEGPAGEALDLDAYAGVGRRYPWIGGIFAVLLIAMAGFPPTGGFLAKFYVFSAAVRAGHPGLALVGVLTSLVSVYYYLRIVMIMFMREPEREPEVAEENPAVYLVLFLCLYAVLQLGLFPGNVVTLIRQATASIL